MLSVQGCSHCCNPPPPEFCRASGSACPTWRARWRVARALVEDECFPAPGSRNLWGFGQSPPPPRPHPWTCAATCNSGSWDSSHHPGIRACARRTCRRWRRCRDVPRILRRRAELPAPALDVAQNFSRPSSPHVMPSLITLNPEP